jgi:uncharacterized membrane protein
MRKTLITGFALLIPVIMTAYFIIFTINIAAIPFYPLSKNVIDLELAQRFDFVKHHIFFQKLFAKLLAIIFLVLAAYLFGFFMKNKIKKYLIDKPLNFLKKIPVLGFFINLTDSVSHKIFDPKNKKIFKKAVLMPFFSEKRYALGLVTSEKAPAFAKQIPEIEQVIFIPTSPHPVCGFLVLTDKQAAHLLKLDPSEALAYIISCGASSQ